MPLATHSGSHPSLTSEQLGLLSRYQRRRTASRRLNDRLLDRLPRGALARCAKELGLVRDRGIVLVNLDVEGAMVMDYALHDHRPTADRRSIAERFCSSAFDREAASLDRDEAEARRHRVTARFALLQICDAVVGLGVHAYDALRGGEPFLLADVSLSRTGEPGVHLVTRIVDAGDFLMSTGASLPVDDAGVDAVSFEVAQHFGPRFDDVRRLEPLQQSRLARHVLRICLARYAITHADAPQEGP
jgi:hypothetical protein